MWMRECGIEVFPRVPSWRRLPFQPPESSLQTLPPSLKPVAGRTFSPFELCYMELFTLLSNPSVLSVRVWFDGRFRKQSPD